MAFTRKTYTGPVKNRGTIARGGKKLADVSKEELDAFRKKAGNEDLSYKEALRKLLNADRNAKPASKSNVTPRKVSDADIKRATEEAAKAKAKPVTKPEFMDLLDRNNPLSKYMEKLPDNRSAEARGAGTAIAMEKMPDNRPVAEGAKYGDKSGSKPAYSTMPDNRSAKDASKYTTGMMGGGKVKGYGPGGSIGKGYGKARGAKACKIR
jgi:hypothetical protein